MDNLTLNGELEDTLVLSLVEEIEVAAAIIIVFLVRYFVIWDAFLFRLNICFRIKLLICCTLRNIRNVLQLSGKSAAPLFSHLSISPHLHWLLGKRVVAIHLDFLTCFHLFIARSSIIIWFYQQVKLDCLCSIGSGTFLLTYFWLVVAGFVIVLY